MQRDVVELPSGASVTVACNGHIIVMSAEMGRCIDAIAQTQPGTLANEMAWARHWVEHGRLYRDAGIQCVKDVGFPPVPIFDPLLSPLTWRTHLTQ